MSISSEITRISNAKTAIAQSIANKGVTVPSGTKIDGMAALIDSIQTGGGGAVQPSKALTVTSNGTTTITPDAPYDAIKQVDLTVNVASGGGGGYNVTFPASSGNYSNWNKFDTCYLIKADGTRVNFMDYNVVAGKTISNVMLMCAGNNRYYGMSGSLSEGSMIVCNFESGSPPDWGFFHVITGSFVPFYSTSLFKMPFVFTADTIISSINAYNAD